MKQNKQKIDKDTKEYIRKIKLLQTIILGIISISFIFFAHTIVLENKDNLKQVALAEVQEAMQETINNLSIHIETIRARIEDEALIDIIDLTNRMKTDGVEGVEDILSYLEVCEENQLGQAIESIYITKNNEIYYINAFDREIKTLDGASVEEVYQEAPVCNIFEIEEQTIIVFINQADIDELAKEEIRNYIHSEYYEESQYVWVNEILNMEGGDNYAIRRIHPSLVESEGEYLSTSIQDIMGNYPYKTELEGIRENGEVFHFYYFKNKIGDDIQEKYSYAKYYEPFHWIISTGETIEEVYAYSKEINERNIQYIILLMFVFGGIFVLTSGIMIKILGKQAKSFQEKLYKQTELLEDMYTTMSIGMLRVAMTDKQTKLIRINPKGLELLGVETEQECNSKIQGHMIKTMYLEDAEKLTQECEYLTEQWTSVVVECRVKWKDESIHLLRIRNTLVDFDGEVKIIQRMCQDITEERLQQEKELMEAEEKATLDPMTQIKNKKAIEMIVRTNIRESAEKNVPIAVGFVDIDNFRDYNTKYGHLQGDEVIKYVASTLRDNIPGIVGRNGGDEFVFCILNASYQQVEESMKVIYKKLNEGVIIKESGEKIPTPCSIGIVIEQSATLQYNDVMEQSDVAMYESKSRGKNTYTILEHYENIK